MMRANGIDWLQIVLLAVVGLSIIALVAMDLYG